MGTSHRHTPTVKGQPNWGKASSSITSVAKAVAESDKLDANPPAGMSSSQVEHRQSTLGRRITKGYHHSVRNLVRAAGGRSRVSTGTSKALGHAGVIVAGRFASIINEISSNGLAEWLRQKGVSSLEGKQCHDVIDIIRQYIETGVAGLDETAANDALESILENLEERVGTDITAIDEAMNRIVSSDELKDMLDQFFGMYIFSHLSQNFEEKLEYERGSDDMKSVMNEIKDQIVEDIRSSRNGRSVATIDWSKPDGDVFIKEEFDRILFILQGHED